MNILLLASHSVAEYDDIRMFTDLGYDIFCPGGYQNPAEPGESLRPALPDAPYHPDLVEACEDVRRRMGDPGNRIDWAKASLPDEVLDWADVIIVHHFPEQWIGYQWNRIRHKRVIWRTCGQSDPRLEKVMETFHYEGMQIVRYSPKEAFAFKRAGMWAGQDALIRFGKYPDDYGPYVGDVAAVGNITQDLAKRGQSCGYDRWQQVTANLPTNPAGPGSEELRGGIGPLTYERMLTYLGHIRTYLYLGTQPASYTLGLIEAMLSGVPIVPLRWQVAGLDWQWLWDLWEGNDILGATAVPTWDMAKINLDIFLHSQEHAAFIGAEQRQRAVEQFDVATVGAQWKAFLG